MPRARARSLLRGVCKPRPARPVKGQFLLYFRWGNLRRGTRRKEAAVAFERRRCKRECTGFGAFADALMRSMVRARAMLAGMMGL